MVRLVCSQPSNGQVRMRVIHRHVNIRHRFSQAFLKTHKIYLKQDNTIDTEDALSAELLPQQPADSETLPNSLSPENSIKNDVKPVVLPSLSTFLKQNLDSPDILRAQWVPEKRSPVVHGRTKTRRSAYEELRSKLDRM